MTPRFRAFVRFLLWLGLGGLALATLFSFLGRVHWAFDLFSHFPLQMGVSLLALATAAVGLRLWKAALVAAILSAPHFVNLGYYYPTREFPAAGADLRVVSFNVLTSNRSYEPVREYLKAADADIILLIETNGSWIDALASLEADYPHTVKAPRGDNFGMTLYSRHPIVSHQFHRVLGTSVPCLEAFISIDGTNLKLICAHPAPPVGTSWAASRNASLATIAKLALPSEFATLVLGDFNATVWSPFLRDLLDTPGLQDSGHKRGYQATWQRRNPLFAIPIDHILHSGHLVCSNRSIGPALGSDHRPVMAEFSWTPR